MSIDLSTASTKTVGQRIAANTGLMVGAKVLGVLMGLLTLKIATNSLQPFEFGTLVFLHGYMLFFSEVGTFQSWQSIIRYGTDDVKERNHQRLAELIGFGIRLDAIAAIVAYLASLAIFGIIGYLATFFPGLGPEAAVSGEKGFSAASVQNYAALYCLLVLFRQRGASIGIFRLFDKFHVLAIKAVIMPVVRCIGAIIAALSGAGFEGFLWAWFLGSLAAYIFLPTMAILELKKRGLLGAVIRARVNFLRPRACGRVWPFVFKSNIDSTLSAANLHLPLLLVTLVFGQVWAGIYKIAEEVAKLLSEGFRLLDQVIYPELAKMISNGEADKIWKLVSRAAVMLLSFGLFISAIFVFIGPAILWLLASEEFVVAAPLASLLVLAAALLATAAPLYPIFYAADKPHRAIYARGAGVMVYIITFFIFAFTIGKMAPAWAAIFGNATAVILVVFLAKKTLNNAVALEQGAHATMDENIGSADSFVEAPSVKLTGNVKARIWGMPLIEWQTRLFKKNGAILNGDNPQRIIMDRKWVLSSTLAKALVGTRDTVLVQDGHIIAIHADNPDETLLGQSANAARHPIKSPEDLAGSYDKTLRKTETPYALDIETTNIDSIMRRQFASSYKGITDFVTKFFWPIPAYHVTRLCAVMRLTPNMVTTIGFVLMLAALYWFWQGQWWLGFAAGWVMTFLDTVDGKLARTTMTYSWWGNIYDHGIDLIHPPFWYWAWFIGLGGVFSLTAVGSDPLMLSLVAILAGYIIDRIIEGIFIAQHGFHIHVWKPINSGLRFITARRNPNMFIFMIGIALMTIWPSAAIWGFHAVAIWTWICIGFNIGVIIVASVWRGPVTSWMDGG